MVAVIWMALYNTVGDAQPFAINGESGAYMVLREMKMHCWIFSASAFDPFQLNATDLEDDA